MPDRLSKEGNHSEKKDSEKLIKCDSAEDVETN